MTTDRQHNSVSNITNTTCHIGHPTYYMLQLPTSFCQLPITHCLLPTECTRNFAHGTQVSTRLSQPTQLLLLCSANPTPGSLQPTSTSHHIRTRGSLVRTPGGVKRAVMWLWLALSAPLAGSRAPLRPAEEPRPWKACKVRRGRRMAKLASKRTPPARLRRQGFFCGR